MSHQFFPWVEIDLSTLKHNLDVMRKLVGRNVKVAATIKANAYGHGLVEIAKFFEKQKIYYLCVARISEALKLREFKIKAPILVLGYTPAEYFQEIVTHNLAVTVQSLDVAKMLATEGRRKNKIVKIHVKVETGMHRIGIESPQILFFIKKILDLPNLEIEGIFTHFADVDNYDLDFAKLQLSRFQFVVDELQKAGIKIPILHTANSAATLRLLESYYNMIRPGLALYGLNPASEVYSDDDFSLKSDLEPVLSFKTRISHIRDVPMGETIGYGRTFKTDQDTLVGTISVGYGDGFRRAPQNYAEVLVRGIRCPILGRVAMDTCQIDITKVPQVNVSDEVVLIRKSQDEIITASEVAKKLGTINYEVVTGIMERVERRYK